MGTTAPWETTCRVKCPAGISSKTYWVVVKESCTLWPCVVLCQQSTCKPRVVSRGSQLAVLSRHPRTQKFKLNKVHLGIRKKLEKLVYSLEIFDVPSGGVSQDGCIVCIRRCGTIAVTSCLPASSVSLQHATSAGCECGPCWGHSTHAVTVRKFESTEEQLFACEFNHWQD